jgi:ribosomal protein S18 acetylase RimI-like enzyme
MIHSQYAFCILCKNREIIGFVCGTVSVGGFYREFLGKNFLKAGILLFPKLFNPIFARKIVETLCYPAKGGNVLPEAELLSIAVDETYRGKGMSQRLFSELVEEFKRRNVQQFKVVVGEKLIAACKFYEKMGGILHPEIEVHKGEKSKIYVWRI